MNEMSTKQVQAEVCTQLQKSEWTLAKNSLDELVQRKDVREKLPALSTFKRSKTLPMSYRKTLSDLIAQVNLVFQSRQDKLGWSSK